MKKLILLGFVLLSLIGCATVPHYETEKVEFNEVEQSPVLEEPMERFLKRKVAITRFTNETSYGSGNLFKVNDDIGKQATDILSTKLVKTDKFILLEREDLGSILAESEIADLESFNISAEFLIVGSVTEFGRRTVSNSGAFSRNKNQTAYAKVNVRLVDVKTGRIIYAETGEGEASSDAETTMGFGKREGYNTIINDKAIDAAISKLVNNIIENLTDKPWRSFILDVQDESVIIAGGKLQGLEENDTFGIYRKGKEVVNPQTGIKIELPGTLIGKVQVIAMSGNTVDDEIAICSLVEGDLTEVDFSTTYVEEIK